MKKSFKVEKTADGVACRAYKKERGSLGAIAKKELLLSASPYVYFFALLGALTIIPSYPAIVGIGYFMLAVFTADGIRRSNRDVEFTATLPIERKDVVTGRMLFLAVIEALFFATSGIAAAVADFVISPAGNPVGLDPNLAFFGVALIGTGAFNAIYLAGFFKTGYKAGVPIIKGLIAFLLVYAVVEGLCFVPQIKSVLDGIGGAYLWVRAIVFAVGAAAYVGLSAIGVAVARKRFEKVSL